MALAVTSAPFQQVNLPALDLRRYLSLGFQEGVATSGDMLVAQRAAGANMSVDIAAGQAAVSGDSITNQGLYYAYNDATFNLTGFSAANATNPRIDRVALRVRDAFHGDAANDLAFVILSGTATAGATLSNLTGAATVPGGHLLLANVLIPAASSSIMTANIGDVRPYPMPPGYEFGYASITSTVTPSSTTEASPTTVVTAPAVTVPTSTTVMVKFYAAQVNSPTTAAGNFTMLSLYSGGTSVGQIAAVQCVVAGQSVTDLVNAEYRTTLAAGTYTYSVGAWCIGSTTNASVVAASGRVPAFIRITKV